MQDTRESEKKKYEISVGEKRQRNACGDCFLYCFPGSWCGGRYKQEKAVQPANFKPITCKWDNYCRCFVLAAGITWIKRSATVCSYETFYNKDLYVVTALHYPTFCFLYI